MKPITQIKMMSAAPLPVKEQSSVKIWSQVHLRRRRDEFSNLPDFGTLWRYTKVGMMTCPRR